MKSIQFKLSEEKYRRAKERLEEAGLSWQTVCEQMSEHIIYSDSLDEFGLPLHEMAPSVVKRARSEAEGHLETSLWKYIQIQMDPHGRNASHWRQGLRAALTQLIRSNSNKNFKRGYFFDQPTLESILDEMFPNAVLLAAGHLGLETEEIKVPKPTLGELFSFAGISFSLKR